jgi:titin
MSPAYIAAIPALELTRPIVRIELLQSMPPISGTLASEGTLALEPQAGTLAEPAAPEATIVGILLQRSEDGGPWEDLGILPPGTTVFTDTGILADASYAYRAQNLMSDGENSDFQATLEVVQSYPALPAAPALDSVQATGADSLSLAWPPDPGSVATAFRIERGDNAGGPFTPVLTVTGEVSETPDTGLSPATSYYYRLVAINATGESAPPT